MLTKQDQFYTLPGTYTKDMWYRYYTYTWWGGVIRVYSSIRSYKQIKIINSFSLSPVYYYCLLCVL